MAAAPYRIRLWLLVVALAVLVWFNIVMLLAQYFVTIIGPDPHTLWPFQVVDAMSLIGSLAVLYHVHRCTQADSKMRSEHALAARGLSMLMAVASIIEPVWSIRYAMAGDIGWTAAMIGHANLGIIGVILFAACGAVVRGVARERESS